MMTTQYKHIEDIQGPVYHIFAVVLTQEEQELLKNSFFEHVGLVLKVDQLGQEALNRVGILEKGCIPLPNPQGFVIGAANYYVSLLVEKHLVYIVLVALDDLHLYKLACLFVNLPGDDSLIPGSTEEELGALGEADTRNIVVVASDLLEAVKLYNEVVQPPYPYCIVTRAAY